MDIKGIGPTLVEYLERKEIITDIADIMTLTKEQLLTVDGLGNDSANNILEAIKDAKSRMSTEKILRSLGIRRIGKMASENIAKVLPSMEDIFDKDKLKNVISTLKDTIGPAALKE